jgi:leucyl aminopeptidase (aminopeptidase T)
MRNLRRTRLTALAVLATLVLAACSTADQSSSGDDATTTPPATEESSPEATETDDETAGEELPAAELRITLERQLGQHALLAIEAMREGVKGTDEFEAAAAALAQNTDDLTGSIELVYGEEGADTFRTQWENHIDLLVQYTQATAEGDEQAKEQAKEGLDQYREDFGSFIETATEGELEGGAVADLLQAHVNQLTEQVDAFSNDNFDKAYTVSREAHAHMFMTAKGLAGAIAGQSPDRFTGDAETGAVELRSALGQLLGEHAQLAIQAMRNGGTGDDDFQASADALAGNTDDLTAAIESVYGEEGGEAFRTQWENHIDLFVQYTQGAAEGDDAKKDQALGGLEQYKEDFASFLDEASEGNIPSDAAASSLQMHVDQLVEQIDAYLEEDYDTAYSTSYEAYNHMYDTASAIAAGIAAQMPDQFPGGDAAAGGESGTEDGMDHSTESSTE